MTFKDNLIKNITFKILNFTVLTFWNFADRFYKIKYLRKIQHRVHLRMLITAKKGLEVIGKN